MALKEIEYTVGLYGIEPSYRLDGGVQGDHEVTQLKFTITKALYEQLGETAGTAGGKIYYRFDRFNGEGDYDPTEEQELVSQYIVCPIDEWLTRYGGIIKVTLVISVEREDETVSELHRFTAVLSLKSRPTLQHSNGYVYKSLNSMSASAKLSAKLAQQSAEQAEESEKNAVNAANDCKACVEELDGAEVIFKSNLDDEGQPLDFDFRIDGSLSSVSKNPVQNKAITQEFKKMSEYINRQLEMYKPAIESAILLNAHPIGSYYWSDDSKNPAEIFGGIWERVKDKFILAAGDEFTAHTSGGTKDNELTESQLPAFYFFGTDYLNESSPVQRRAIDSTVFGVTSDYYVFAGKSNREPVGDEKKADTTGLKWILSEKEPVNNMPPYRVAYCWIRIA